ncbi:hypothetical protein ACVGOW_21515 [Pseudonocardia saturnea]
MSNRAVLLWFVFGLPIAMIDAWLSVQSMFGLVNPTNFLGYLVAVLSGIALTALAVYVPVLRAGGRRPLLILLWILALTTDL